MDGSGNSTTRIVVVHHRRRASGILAERVERALGRLGCQTMIVDVSQTPLTDESGDHASLAASTIAAAFRPDAVVLCGTAPSAENAWRLPTIIASNEMGNGPDIVQLPPDVVPAEIDERMSAALSRAMGRSIDTGSAPPIRTVLVSGYFGAGNRGDDVIVSTLLQAIDAVPDTRVVLASPLPHRAVADYGRPAFDRLDPEQCDRWASVASAVLLGPGGLWDDYSIGSVGGFAGVITGARRSPAHLVQLPILVRGYGGRFHGVGLGAGPLRDEASRAAVRLSIELADHLTVRDDESRRLLAEIAPKLADRTEVSPDLAWATEVPDVREYEELSWLPGNPWIAFNVRPWGTGEVAQQRVWSETCSFAGERGLAIVCVPMQDQDAHMMRSFQVPDNVAVTHMPFTATHLEFMATIAGAEAVVAMRLHASLLGHAAGTPGVGISYHPKVASHYLDVERGDFVGDVESEPGSVAHRLRRALDEGVGEEHAARVLQRRQAAKTSLAQLCAQLQVLPAFGIGEAWNAVPTREPKQASLELSGTMVPLENAVVTGRNLLEPEREVRVESSSTEMGGLVIAMTDRAPRRADLVEAVLNVPTVAGTGYRISMHLQPRCQELARLVGRMVHEVLVDGTPGTAMDCAKWKPRTSLWITGAANANSTTITVRTRAMRDCEDWGWGASSALTIEAMTAEPWQGQEELLSSSNPFATSESPPV